MIWAGLGFVFFLAFASCFWAFSAGKNSAKSSKAQQINDAALKAMRIRDRLHHDSGYAERLRKRFSR